MLRLKQTQFTPTATFIGAPRGRIPHYFAQIVQMPVRGAPPPLSMHLMGWWVGFMGWSWEKNNVKPLSNCEASDMTCIFNIIYRCSKGNKTTALQSLQSDLILWTLWVHDIQTSTPFLPCLNDRKPKLCCSRKFQVYPWWWSSRLTFSGDGFLFGTCAALSFLSARRLLPL